MSNLSSLAGYTTLGIGGTAQITVVHSIEELIKHGSSSVVLGMGSNVLVSDRGVRDEVVINRACAYKITDKVLYAQSGCSLSVLSKECSKMGLSGLEWAYLLPASVGGAVVMNAGAFGGQLSDIIVKVGILRGGRVVELSNEECGFSYRASGIKPQDTVLYAYFKLCCDGAERCMERLRKVKNLRAKQPSGKSAGCIYKTEGKSAGWYIEQAGLKNARVGDIYVSPVHAGFFINAGRGTARDMLNLMERVEKTVQDKFSKTLTREIKLIGEF